MGHRRPGPEPKTPETRRRRNADPVAGSDGWVELDPSKRAGAPPSLPAWLPDLGEDADALYRQLARLPQARVWLDSEWFLLQLALPLIKKYLQRPGSESFKALTAALSPSLKLTSDDLAKARMRWKKKDIEQGKPAEGEPSTAPVAARRRSLVVHDGGAGAVDAS